MIRVIYNKYSKGVYLVLCIAELSIKTFFNLFSGKTINTIAKWNYEYRVNNAYEVKVKLKV